jgi:hypothetical protein
MDLDDKADLSGLSIGLAKKFWVMQNRN